MDKKTVRDLGLDGKRVLLRVDFNVPKDSKGGIADDSRIKAALPTIRYLLERGARPIVCSHMGRPGGRPDPAESLGPVSQRLQHLLEVPVSMAPDCVGPQVRAMARSLGPDTVLLLENLRFHSGEEENDPAFAGEIASLGEVYVNDAFGAAHRAHASTEGVARLLPAVAGFLMEKELEFLGRALSSPEMPMAAIVGGAKASDKIAVLEHMIDRVQALLVGGGMVATFLRAKGLEVGDSLVEEDKQEVAARLERRASQKGVGFHLPPDLVVAERFDAEAPGRDVDAGAVPSGWVIMDIGPRARELFSTEISRCRTAVWNGPMGVFEMPQFSEGTREVARALASMDGTTIVGGGSTAEAVHSLGLQDKMSHVSTGGGASLEFLEGKVLPGVAALMDG